MAKPSYSTRATIFVTDPFDWHATVYSHGWVDLLPFHFDSATETLGTALVLDGFPVDVDVTPERKRGALRVRATGNVRWTARLRTGLVATVRRMLGLDDDLEAFWHRASTDPNLQWAAERGAGRMLRAPTLFEDLLKILFTTNCSWAATRTMTDRLVSSLGEITVSGRRTFPTALACASEPAAFFRETVRAGYRAEACVQLAERCARRDFAEFEPGSKLATSELRDRLLEIRGFGPYAAGQALRLLGRHDDLALDSWCRARIRELWPRRKTDDRAIARAFAAYGAHQGLALWLYLTASWHDEGPSPGRRPFESS